MLVTDKDEFLLNLTPAQAFVGGNDDVVNVQLQPGEIPTLKNEGCQIWEEAVTTFWTFCIIECLRS
jgi:hypothetical protein